MSGTIPPLSSTPSCRGGQLKKVQGQLYFTLCCVHYRSEGIPVINFHAECSKCQGFWNAHRSRDWIFFKFAFG